MRKIYSRVENRWQDERSRNLSLQAVKKSYGFKGKI